jgi:hypothetical protein
MADPKPKAPSKPKRWLKSIGEFFGLMFKGWGGKASLVLLALALGSCASLGNIQPVGVLCMSCRSLAATGACDKTLNFMAPPSACPAGEGQYVTNYVDVIERGATPRIECRRQR